MKHEAELRWDKSAVTTGYKGLHWGNKLKAEKDGQSVGD